jgi:hypothetical protein
VTPKSQVVHVEVGPDRKDDAARISRASVVGTMAPKSARYQNEPELRSALDALVAAGVNDCGERILVLEKLLAHARTEQAAARVTYDACHNTATAQLEKGATELDVTACGFGVLHRVLHGLALPNDLTTKYDRNKRVLSIHVQYGWRNEQCVVEIANAEAGPYQRLDGSGVTRKVASPAPGIWWIRAATMRAAGQSAWFGPRAVVVD